MLYFCKIFYFLLFFVISCDNSDKDSKKIQDYSQTPRIIDQDVISETDVPLITNNWSVSSPSEGSARTGNPDDDNFPCTIRDPDSDNDGICDSFDKCPGFDDGINEDRDISPAGCDCDDHDPSVFPGVPCLDHGLDDKCVFRICDDNLSGQCLVKFRPEGAVCEVILAGVCDAPDVCDGNGTCIDKKREGFICRRQAGACDIAEECDGINNQCPTNIFAAQGSICGLDNLGSCRNDGTCDRVNPCPGATSQIDADGDNWVVQCDCDDNNPAIYPGTSCDSDSLECTFDICSPEATGQCLHEALPVNFACGAGPTDSCDAQDTCNSLNQCVDNVDPATFICRVQDHQCDLIEFCDGVNKACPPNTLAPVGALCGDAVAGICDRPDSCDQQGNCVNNFANSNTVCRAKLDECDLPENCTGSSASCPANLFEPDNTPCGPGIIGACDLADYCMSGECFNDVLPNTTECRPSINNQPIMDYQCDPAEFCDGISSQCPANIISPDGQTNISCASCSPGLILCIDGEASCYATPLCTKQNLDTDSNFLSLLGTSVAINGDTAIAGAPFDSNNNGLITGSASTFFYNELSGLWQFETTLPVPVNDFSKFDIIADVSQGIGMSVALLNGFNLVGAPDVKVESGGFGSSKSAGALFSYDQGQLNTILFSPHPDDRANFGQSVAINGNWVAIGDSASSFCGQNKSGEVLIYQYNSTFNSLTYIQSLCTSDHNADDGFGYSITISGDWLLASAYNDDTGSAEDSGSGYFFQLNPQTNLWEEKQKVGHTNPDDDDQFGYSVDIDGDVAVIGAPYDDTNTGNDAGSIFIYRFNGISWVLDIGPIESPTPFEDGIFGNGVAIEGDVVVAGQPMQPYETVFNGEKGRAFIYIYTNAWNIYQTLVGDADFDTFGTDVDISEDWIMVGSPASAGAPLDIDLKRIKFYYFPYNSVIKNPLP